ncbi:MAG TPA: hypothetical protein ENN79_07570 [Desulfobacteraceae bacterium]|nr:hypothetical protein [Desulfobacteraceae bacterium]
MNSGNSSLESSEWRIKPIPFSDPCAMMETNWGAIFGALLFIGGIFAGFKVNELFTISIAGLLIGLISILLRGRILRRNWKKLLAKVIDQEYKSVFGPPGPRGGSRKVWAFQLLCEFDFEGKHFTVTPGYWSTFVSESKSQIISFKSSIPGRKVSTLGEPQESTSSRTDRE